ncbi:MAG: undecaprenyl-diphosphate phosphatase [Acidobacteria bacterium]|nr:undecaprenyl-diphosphate phosphatase [Acidobacteriota bacterium]
MPWWEALLLAVVQGLTEFLPVSSSAHLALLQAGMGDFDLSFSILLHLGTLVSLLIYFRADFLRILRGLLPRREPPPGPGPFAEGAVAYLALLGAAMVPTGVIGPLLKRATVAASGRPAWMGAFLLVTGGILLLPRWVPGRPSPRAEVRLWQALLIGSVQGMAVLPGISRSGSTIVAGILAGLDPVRAARFSFHLSVPAILGAAAYEGFGAGSLRGWLSPPALLGFAVAAATGLAAIDLLLRLISRRRLEIFSLYCAVLGAAVLLLSLRSGSW